MAVLPPAGRLPGRPASERTDTEGPHPDSTVLLTGFEPYGGQDLNPSALVVQRLDGAIIGGTAPAGGLDPAGSTAPAGALASAGSTAPAAGTDPAGGLAPAESTGARIVGRTLPVAFRDLRPRLEALLEQLRPRVVLCLGLAPGEPVLRLETVGLNLAQFEIPDNEGLQLADAPVEEGGGPALLSTLPLARIERRLLQAGIPVRRSTSAGTYICNAALYTALSLLQARGTAIPCGFLHLPYLPEQVAGLLQRARAARLPEPRPADLASMALETMVHAVRLALETALTATD